MDFEEFVQTSCNIVGQYYRHIDCQKSSKRYTLTNPILYPSMMIAYEFPNYYLVEFTGLRSSFSNFKIVLTKGSSIDGYFHLTEERLSGYAFTNVYDRASFGHLAFSQDENFDEARKRFPIVNLMKSRFIIQGRKLFGLRDDFRSLSMDNCVVVNRHKDFYRCKNILAAFLFRNSISKKDLIECFHHYLPAYVGPGEHHLRYVISGDHQNIVLASQLQSLYLSNDVRETTIGEFFNRHAEAVKRAFRTDHFVYEPYLQWIEHDGTIEESAIKPDLLIRRPDGFYDIYDLKKAAIRRANLTRASSNRRRPVDYVAEGIAQLANYAEYFSYGRNKEFAFNKYGIQVKKPRLYLVVGNSENVDPVEIKQALRSYREEVHVIDYDSISMLLALPQGS